MDTTLDTITARPSHGKWWVLLLGSCTAAYGALGPLMDPRASSDVKIGAGCAMALLVGLMFLARSRLPSMSSRRNLSERLQANPALVLDNSHPKVAFAMACIGAGLIAIYIVSIVIRVSFDPEHRPDGLLRACSSYPVIVVGVQWIMWAWTRPWDTQVKRMVDA